MLADEVVFASRMRNPVSLTWCRVGDADAALPSPRTLLSSVIPSSSDPARTAESMRRYVHVQRKRRGLRLGSLELGC